MNNHKKLYIGSVTRDGSLVRVKSDHAEYQLPLRLNIRNHSPTGFAWGYGGSGPAQLSLAILVDHFHGRVSNAGNAKWLAEQLYQTFKFSVISSLAQDQGWAMTDQDISRSLCEIVIDDGESFIDHVVAGLLLDLEDEAIDPGDVTAAAVSTLVEAFAMSPEFAETLIDQVHGERRSSCRQSP
jgi:hypothetical protein